MYCPRCGQSPATDEVMFCSGCGLPLGGVQRLLADGGVLPSAPEVVGQGKSQSRLNRLLNGDDGATRFSPRRRGINQGLLLWMIGAVLVPLLVVLSDGDPDAVVPAAILFYIGGLMRMLYAIIFQDGKRQTEARMSNVNPAATYAPPLTRAPTSQPSPPAALPASPAAKLSRSGWRTTAELVTPPSVTDHTTRLLEMQETEVRRRKTE